MSQSVNRPLRWALMGAVAAGLVAGTWWLQRPTEPASLAEATQSPSWDKPVAADGAFALDGQQQLRVDSALRARFDYLLNLATPPDLTWLRRQLEQQLAQAGLPAAARQQALLLFGRYVEYRRALATLTTPGGNGQLDARQVRASLDARATLRLRFFDAADARGLFGAEQDEDEAMLARLELQQRPGLSGAERQRLLAELDSRLPPGERAARQAPVQHLLMAQQAAALRAQGASEDDIYRQRASEFGQAVAERLAELDRSEQGWQQRLSSYRQAAAALDADSSLSADARAQALATLQQRFTPQEQRRLVGALALQQSQQVAAQ
ncbi:lipase secretion chaperone [Neisseriaceae bacterium JH1-16]|nr:lipase secretion chaperone [Neisseriaceae bacterium JH1-16]